MFARLSSLFVLFFIAFCVSASAVVPRGPGDPPASQCNAAGLYCCNSVTQANNPVVGVIAGLLGIVIGSITGLVGLGCTPLILGITNSCTAQPVCCTGNNYGGIIVLGCSPININL